jgi:hypothetical protein
LFGQVKLGKIFTKFRAFGGCDRAKRVARDGPAKYNSRCLERGVPPEGPGGEVMSESSKSVSLTGRWSGHDVQRDQERVVWAEFLHQGERLTGSMHDAQSHFELSVFEMAAEKGLPPGADEQIVSALRQQFPDEPNAPIRALSILPADSLIEGKVRGRTVEFLKVYQGEAFSGYRVGNKQVGVTQSRHSVSYRGDISPDGNTIEGRWWITRDPAQGTRPSEGSFLLRREAKPRSATSGGG